MTHLLKSWLKKDLKLDDPIDYKNFASEWKDGWRYGEVLNILGAQPDFQLFVKSSDPDVILANFARLETGLRRLGIHINLKEIHRVINGIELSMVFLLYRIYLKANSSDKTIVSEFTIYDLAKQLKREIDARNEHEKFIQAEPDIKNSDDEKFDSSDDNLIEYWDRNKFKKALKARDRARIDNFQSRYKNMEQKNKFLVADKATNAEANRLMKEMYKKHHYDIKTFDALETYKYDSSDKMKKSFDFVAGKSGLAKLVWKKKPDGSTSDGVRQSTGLSKMGRFFRPKDEMRNIYIESTGSEEYGMNRKQQINSITFDNEDIFTHSMTDRYEQEQRMSNTNRYVKNLRDRIDREIGSKREVEHRHYRNWLELAEEQKQQKDINEAQEFLNSITRQSFDYRAITDQLLFQRRRQHYEFVIRLANEKIKSNEQAIKYAKSMVVEGMWDMQMEDIRNENKLKQWCAKAGFSVEALNMGAESDDPFDGGVPKEDDLLIKSALLEDLFQVVLGQEKENPILSKELEDKTPPVLHKTRANTVPDIRPTFEIAKLSNENDSQSLLEEKSEVNRSSEVEKVINPYLVDDPSDVKISIEDIGRSIQVEYVVEKPFRKYIANELWFNNDFKTYHSALQKWQKEYIGPIKSMYGNESVFINASTFTQKSLAALLNEIIHLKNTSASPRRLYPSSFNSILFNCSETPNIVAKKLALKIEKKFAVKTLDFQKLMMEAVTAHLVEEFFLLNSTSTDDVFEEAFKHRFKLLAKEVIDEIKSSKLNVITDFTMAPKMVNGKFSTRLFGPFKAISLYHRAYPALINHAPIPTPRSILGKEVLQCIENGNEIPEILANEIILEAIDRIIIAPYYEIYLADASSGKLGESVDLSYGARTDTGQVNKQMNDAGKKSPPSIQGGKGKLGKADMKKDFRSSKMGKPPVMNAVGKANAKHGADLLQENKKRNEKLFSGWSVINYPSNISYIRLLDATLMNTTVESLDAMDKHNSIVSYYLSDLDKTQSFVSGFDAVVQIDDLKSRLPLSDDYQPDQVQDFVLKAFETKTKRNEEYKELLPMPSTSKLSNTGLSVNSAVPSYKSGLAVAKKSSEIVRSSEEKSVHHLTSEIKESTNKSTMEKEEEAVSNEPSVQELTPEEEAIQRVKEVLEVLNNILWSSDDYEVVNSYFERKGSNVFLHRLQSTVECKPFYDSLKNFLTDLWGLKCRRFVDNVTREEKFDQVCKVVIQQFYLRQCFVRHCLVTPLVLRLHGEKALDYLLERDKVLSKKLLKLIPRRLKKFTRLCENGVFGERQMLYPNPIESKDVFTKRKALRNDTFLVQILLERKWQAQQEVEAASNRVKLIIKPLTREFSEPRVFSQYIQDNVKLSLAEYWSKIEEAYVLNVQSELSSANNISQAMKFEHNRLWQIVQFYTNRKLDSDFSVYINSFFQHFYCTQHNDDRQAQLMNRLKKCREKCLDAADWHREEAYQVLLRLVAKEHQFNSVLFKLYNHAIRLAEIETKHFTRTVKFMREWSKWVINGFSNNAKTQLEFDTNLDATEIDMYQFPVFREDFKWLHWGESVAKLNLSTNSQQDNLSRAKSVEFVHSELLKLQDTAFWNDLMSMVMGRSFLLISKSKSFARNPVEIPNIVKDRSLQSEPLDSIDVKRVTSSEMCSLDESEVRDSQSVSSQLENPFVPYPSLNNVLHYKEYQETDGKPDEIVIDEKPELSIKMKRQKTLMQHQNAKNEILENFLQTGYMVTPEENKTTRSHSVEQSGSSIKVMKTFSEDINAVSLFNESGMEDSNASGRADTSSIQETSLQSQNTQEGFDINVILENGNGLPEDEVCLSDVVIDKVLIKAKVTVDQNNSIEEFEAVIQEREESPEVLNDKKRKKR